MGIWQSDVPLPTVIALVETGIVSLESHTVWRHHHFYWSTSRLECSEWLPVRVLSVSLSGADLDMEMFEFVDGGNLEILVSQSENTFPKHSFFRPLTHVIHTISQQPSLIKWNFCDRGNFTEVRSRLCLYVFFFLIYTISHVYETWALLMATSEE